MPYAALSLLLCAPTFLTPCASAAPGAEPNIAVDDESIGLLPAWTRRLGSAYSGITANADLVVTFYSDGAQDYLVAVNAQDGATRWQLPFGAVYRGHDGSLDGPVSTPVLSADSVFAIGPRGKLVAVDSTTGKERWSKDLMVDLDAEAPEYGFTTTPLLADGLVIVQAGGSEGRNLCAFDAESGALRWSQGEGAGAYQSPTLLELAGRKQVVVLNDKELQGVDPANGQLLWTFAIQGRSSADSGVASAIDESRFFLYISSGLTVFNLTEDGGQFAVEKLYRSRDIGNSYSNPVYHDGYIYGYSRDFLTCVDVEDGSRVWRSRPPGGAGLTLAGDRLVIFGAEGVVAVARATPDGYEEETRVRALEHSSHSWPVYVDGRVYVRNSDGLARLDVVMQAPTEAVAVMATDETAGRDTAFGAFLEELEGASDPKALVEAFLAERESFPIQEEGYVHFLYYGAAEDVAIAGSMTGGSQAHALMRAADTDLFYKSYPIEAGTRWEYNLQVDYGRRITDPRNPDSVPGHYDPFSNVVSKGYEAANFLGAATESQGRLEKQEFHSKQMDNKRELQIYLPAGYDEGDEDYPLLLVHQGPDWLAKGHLKNALDNLIGTQAQPIIAVFITAPGQWWFEAGGSRTQEYVNMLATELVPQLSEKYRISAQPADRALMGVRNFGLTAAYGVVAHPEAFGKAIIQSPILGDVTRHALFELLAKGQAKNAQVYVDWNRYEVLNKDRSEDVRADSLQLVAKLKASGAQVLGGEALDCHGWASWRSRTDDWLMALFPRL